MRIIGVLAIAFLLPAAALAALVNINTADASLLDTLPGIGPSKAAAIVSYRNTHGPFVRVEDIQNVSGIGPITFQKMQEMITVGVSAATTAPTPPPVQPSPAPASYTKVQAPKPVTSTNENTPHEEATISAPTAVVEPAAVGAAAFPEMSPTATRGLGLFHSVWTYGLFGVILVAGGAFILL